MPQDATKECERLVEVSRLRDTAELGEESLAEQQNPGSGAAWAVPLSSRVCERVCMVAALFTLCSHAVVAAGGNLFWLLLLFSLAGTLSVFVSRRLPAPTDGVALVASPPEPRDDRWLRIAGGAIGLCTVVSFASVGEPLWLWLGGVLALSLGAIAISRSAPSPLVLPVASPRSERALLGIAVACAVFALVAHRPDARDAFLVNLAVSAEGRMDLPLLASDTLHGREDLPIHSSLYRLQSHELLAAGVALLTRIPPLYVFHWLIAALGAFLVPLAHAELLRRLTPRHWIAAVGVAMVVLICAGETEAWYGNAAFLRIWQGEALFLFVFAPLLYVFAMRYAESPSARGLARLAAAQIAALGCSAHSLWIAPVLVLAGLLSTAPLSGEGFGRVLRGLLPTLYGVASALFLNIGMGSPVGQVDEPLLQVLGDKALAFVCLTVTFTAWACCAPGPGRRFAVFAPLALLLTWLNPWAGEWIHTNLTGDPHWRTALALPIPLLVTLVIVAPLQSEVRGSRAWLLSAGLCALFALVLPARFGPSTENGVTLRRPGLKVPEEAHHWAGLLNQHAPGRRVVAPADISTWIPTFRDAAHPLMVLPFSTAQSDRIGSTAYRDRYVMTHFAGGERRHPEAAALFSRGLELYGVAAVCVRVSEYIEQTREILRRAGYQRRVQSNHYEIWVRA